MTGSAFSLSAAIPSDGFRIMAGEAVIGGLRANPRHFFCPDCMSWLFTRAEGMDWFVNIRPTMLDDASGFAPFVETWTSEKLPWAWTPATHSFEGFPAASEYEELSKQYAQQRSRAVT